MKQLAPYAEPSEVRDPPTHAAPTAPPGSVIVAACGTLVPSDRQAEWQAEWLGELAYA